MNYSYLFFFALYNGATNTVGIYPSLPVPVDLQSNHQSSLLLMTAYFSPRLNDSRTDMSGATESGSS